MVFNLRFIKKINFYIKNKDNCTTLRNYSKEKKSEDSLKTLQLVLLNFSKKNLFNFLE